MNEMNISFPDPFSRHRGEVGGEGSRGEAGEAGAAVEAMIAWLAHELARRLGDPGSLAFYRLVAATVPLRVVRSALDLALELSPREVRVSRGAYFTSLVRPHLAKTRMRRDQAEP